jgi:hypothetical protein
MRFGFLESINVMGIHAVVGYSSLGLPGVKYNINKLSKCEMKYVRALIKPSILTDWEKI